MTSANYHNKFVAVSDDGQRVLKRSKKRTTEVAGKSSTLLEILLAARGSLIALCFVILLNVHFHYRTKDSLLGGMMRPKRAAAEEYEPIVVTPSFTKKFEDMVSGERDTCQPDPVVFVKTHKTGGTTITNMILRHAERNSMLVGLPIQDHWELAGYPVSFDQRLVDPVAEKYDVLCHHFRFNYEEIEKKMHDNAAYVTIMRNPISNYESIFGFFRDYPFAQWVGRNGTLKNFLSDPERFYDKSTPWYFRAKNYMAYDLGFDNEDTSREYARYAIEEMDKIFDLVMITDRFEESIVLLRDLLCMSDEDVIYLALKPLSGYYILKQRLDEKRHTEEHPFLNQRMRQSNRWRE
ncbi:Oidioi.mRNA.OKI2018_I69.chr1.g2111.t2.cds [Oikopleura dioica]|uniref:Oidioi.mRNA.OKI2018_I69.chr1.g2111.t2.cds n=1 Tax=Oikopleura dioica TaxID=34765 RepID=A0ABN7SV67_OIKDI|nr:Oidioi.mRNA.OKI2018_I69.chr1.g2111.t2.cds [Oikopleura dioica]